MATTTTPAHIFVFSTREIALLLGAIKRERIRLNSEQSISSAVEATSTSRGIEAQKNALAQLLSKLVLVTNSEVVESLNQKDVQGYIISLNEVFDKLAKAL